MTLPQDHPFRIELNDEVHARPPQSIETPARISYLALISPPEDADRERDHVRELCIRAGLDMPESIGNHIIADFGDFWLKWERHTEFARYQILASDESGDAFKSPAISLVPQDWLEQLNGTLLVAANMAISLQEDRFSPETISDDYFSGHPVLASSVAGGASMAFTDFRIGEDGFTRMMILNKNMTPRQTGRTAQRLLEIETYRMMALLTFPVARELRPFVARSNTELAAITNQMDAGSSGGDQPLLERLIQLEAGIESRYADHQYRFSAADAYYDLVRSRIAEMREERLQGFQTFEEFMERRLAPAMSTCRSVSEGIRALSERVERTTQLLSTRVGMAREQQNQKLLETMARRAKLQLRLQQTVEGLSVAAISYYVVGLVGYGAKALQTLGLPVDPNLAMGITLPVVVLSAAFGVRNIRKRIASKSGEPEQED
jgi:uncharacterized membrane-anchored protein